MATLDPDPGPSPRRAPARSTIARCLAGLTLVAISFAAQVAARSAPEEVEALFVRGLYPRLGGRLGDLTDVLPFSLAEALVLVTVLLTTCQAGRLVVGIARRPVGVVPVLARSAANLLLAVGLGYALFLVLWGFNYARLPFATLAGLPVGPAPASELLELSSALVLAANEAREGLPEDEHAVFRIAGGFPAVRERATAGYSAIAARLPFLAGSASRPKAVLLSPLLSYVGVTGIYFPFTGEANVNTTLPDAELPMSAAHELAHQRGFAREDEANYLGYLACRHHPDADFRYSGILAASHYALVALHAIDPAAARSVQGKRSAAVLRDEAALRAWADRYRGRATEVGHRVNDAYLRAHGQKEGLRSYGRMVDLLLAERRARPAAGNGPD